jgi:hypothetical protein
MHVEYFSLLVLKKVYCAGCGAPKLETNAKKLVQKPDQQAAYQSTKRMKKETRF